MKDFKNVGIPKTKQPSMSDRIDRIVTNRWLGLLIFALAMFVVYYIFSLNYFPGSFIIFH